MERRLSAIVSLDMAGYSRLTASDEEGTLSRLTEVQRQLITPSIAEHRGRLIKVMGDGALVEFASVVDAVRFAVDVQKGMQARNLALADDQRILFRIGVNLGDVIVEDGDLFGDGVNVAARLQTLSEPGSICISGTAFDQVEGRTEFGCEFLGVRQLKNVDRSIRVYRILLKPPVAGGSPAARRRRATTWQMSVAIALLFAVAAGGPVAWLRPWEPGFEALDLERMALPLPDKPSIAVLPFANLSGDPSQEYFVDGLTEDLITDLSKVSGLFVIARNSTFAFKGRNATARDVAETLGVRYVLEGSARRAGDQVRVNAQLVDAMTGGQLWAERYDGSVENVFGIQDEFVRAIVGALALTLSPVEEDQIGRGQTTNIAARVAFQRGWEHYQSSTPEENARAAGELIRAVEIDPDYGRAYAALALVYFRGCAWEWNDPLGMDTAQAVEKARQFLSEAKAHPSSLAHVSGAYIALYRGQHEDAFTEATRAIALDPNDPESHLSMAWAMIATGRAEAALDLVGTAMRINPDHPDHYVMARALALFALGELEEAARTIESRLESNPAAIQLAPVLATVYAHLGQREKARRALLMWRPGASEDAFAMSASDYHFPFTWSPGGQRTEERFRDGLMIAALPPEITIHDLTGSLERGSIFERRRAARTLGAFGPHAAPAIEALLKALGDNAPGVRGEAITALRKIGPGARDALPALATVEGDDWLMSLARDAVREISGNEIIR